MVVLYVLSAGSRCRELQIACTYCSRLTKMDGKDVKKLLKDAKEAIKDKDFKTALRLAKAVLKEDRDNYAGLILLGRALQESDYKNQAPNAFRKAAELQPAQALAWQGLASYYEKIGGPTVEDEILNIYENLIPLETNLEKRQEITDKLADIAFRKQKSSYCTNVLKKLKNLPDDTRGLRRSLLKSLLQFKELPEEDTNELETNVEQFLSEWKALDSPNDPDIRECYRRFLKLLYRRRDYKRLIQEALLMVEFFPTDVYPREWLCKVYAELHIEGGVMSREDLSQIDTIILTQVEHSIKANADSKVALVAQAVYHHLNGQTITARDELLRASALPPQTWHLWLLLAEIQLSLGLPTEAATCAVETTTLLSKQKDNVPSLMKRALLVECLARSEINKEEELSKAIKLSSEILKNDRRNETALISLARAHLNRKEIFKASQLIANLDTKGPNWEAAVVLQAKCLIESEQTAEAESLLKIHTEHATSLLWLELARFRNLQGDDAGVISSLREAAKRGPLNFHIFRLLGDYYSGKSGPTAIEKARRCYQEAFRTNPWSDEVGEKLSNTLCLLNDTDGNRQFLESVTRSSDSCWAWLRLGLLYADEGNTDSSVKCLCKAVSKDPTNSRSWESLADAYCLRGSWTSALKSYEHVVELEPTSLYSKYRIAFVKFTLGLYEEALTEFRNLTRLAPHFVPALHGLGETCLSGAKKFFSEHRLGGCHERCQEAVDALSRASGHRRLSCVWKLVGDVCLLVSQLPAPLNQLVVPQNILRASGQGDGSAPEEFSQRTKKLEGTYLLELAARLYCRAMPASLENSLLWHDVAITYHRLAAAISDKEYQRSLLQQALNAARRAVKISPANAEHWNLLGVVAASEGLQQYALAQHAFIRAVKIDLNYATAWTNLGAVYFILGNPELANKMFAAGMRAEPEYNNSWVGQSLVAERLKYDEEVLGLFRHAASLPFHPEAGCGYAQHVLQTVQKPKRNDTDYRFSIERMHAVPVATDCMQWFTGCIKNDACAWNMFGLLLERMGLLKPAESAYLSALNELDENNPEKWDAIATNLGRVLIAEGKFSEAVPLLQKVHKATLASQCTLALALYKAGQYKESYGAYETSLEWMAGDDGVKSHILVAMAASMYTFQRVDDAKTLLLQSVQLRPVSVQALLATCALGILHQDLALTLGALKELGPFRDNPDFLHHIAIFQAYSAFVKGDVKGSLRNLCSAIHRHPNNAALWLALAQLQFEVDDQSSVKAAGHTAYAALVHGRSTMDVSKVLSLVTLAELLAGNGYKSLIRAQQGVHQSPEVAENWVVLIGALLSKPRQNPSWLRRLITHVRRRLETTSPSLNVWLSKNERIIDSKMVY